MDGDGFDVWGSQPLANDPAHAPTAHTGLDLNSQAPAVEGFPGLGLGPSLISSIEDTSLHSSLRQPALGLIYIIIISDASAFISYKLKYEAVKKDNVSNSVMFVDDDDELPFSHDAEEKSQSCWNDFNVLNKLASRECKDWKCIPLLCGTIQRYIEDLDNIISHDAVSIDELEESVSNLKLALSKEAPATVKRVELIDAPMFKEPIVNVPSPVQRRHTGMDNVGNVESTKPSRSPDIHEIILLSDSEDNLAAADVSSEEVLSSVMENDASTASNMSKEVKPPEQRMLTEARHVPLKPQISTPASTEKIKSIFRDISDDEDDPLDHALDNCQKPQIPSAKPSILVPKRQVAQLPVPVGRRVEDKVLAVSALSSLNDIPVLPAILNPVSCAESYHKSGKVHLDRLAHPLRKVLKSSYNESQLQRIAIGSTSSKTKFDLSLFRALQTNNDGKNSSDGESSSSLRTSLDKTVDRIRHYESRRKLIESDKSEDGSPVADEDEVDEVSDEALGGKLNFLYAQKRKVSAELATAHTHEKKIADENKFLKHKLRKSILGEAEIIVTTLSGIP
ncbi:hypothetical protein C2845_PM15G16660 [Panicum miliaceum]|uniref:Uncharacterized protein n=1 Tax=Panicum miliaceum TaxID=4540 RepID=A0A3L6Q4Y2_PANMI|nr:hypothetical protein C2845_PM15G16660 [Panicum miliaceum]